MRHIEIVRSKRSTPSKEEANSAFSKRSWSITRFVGSLAAVTTLAGIVLHGCGHVAYTSYLKAWGVQADLFPQSAEKQRCEDAVTSRRISTALAYKRALRDERFADEPSASLCATLLRSLL